ARAAMPGLLAEMATDPTLHAKLLGRFGDVTSRGMTDRLESAMLRGEVRADVTGADLVEAIAGMTLMAIITRSKEIDDAWVERTAALITKGISA
ncbi:MAG: TetR-like C-terminal domain-containing protein, partial [Mycobacterium sp.]